MVAVASCFFLALIDRVAFAKAVRPHQSEQGPKGFDAGTSS